jgi:HK97 family phage major capsid protein
MNLEQILARLKEIRTALGGTGEVDVKALTEEIRTLNEQKEAIETRAALAKQLNDDPSLGDNVRTFNSIPNPIDARDGKDKIETRTHNQIVREVREKRGEDLKTVLGKRAGSQSGVTLRMLPFDTDEERAVVVGSSNVVLPTAFSDTINDTFNQVSTLLDRVTVMPLMGGESYEKPFVTDYGEGGETTLVADSTDVETTFDLSIVNKSLITAYQTWPREITKLANAPYEQFVSNGIMVALRKRINRQIMFGNGAANNFTGIFDNGANMTALSAANDLVIDAVDDTTLEDLVYGYGGDEDVEDMAVLLLNKQTLKAFSQVRTTDGLPFYKVTLRGNTGTISTMNDGIMVDFLINSAISAIGAAGASVYHMAYGSLSSYEMAIFSDAQILRSEDFLFKSRQIAYNGEVYAGGNVVRLNGFIRAKKSA